VTHNHTGSIAQAFYKGVSKDIAENVRKKLMKDLLEILDEFEESYGKYEL
jgi:predicted lipid-binding transport protein (Tim44 family)